MAVESITDSYTIDLQNTSGHYSVSVPQGDGRSRILKIYIENNHEPYILSDQNTYIFAGKNSSGQGVYTQCEVDVNDNALLISLSGAVLSNSGLGKYVILEYPPTYGTTSNDMAISTFPFNIHVVKSALDMKRMEESNQYQVLADLINKADKMNKWHVVDNDPPTITENVKNGDYCLCTNTGNIYVYTADSWSNTPVGNIKEKLYIRYSHNSNGSNMTVHPVSKESDPNNYSRYIGIYAGIESSAPSYTKFDWILLGEGQKGDKGDKGDTGATGATGAIGPTGNGISSVSKTSTSGLIDTYTILYTNGTSSSFTVKNGQDGSGSGDMTKAVYDQNNVVSNAGGIANYFGWEKINLLKIPSNIVDSTINGVNYYINRNINQDVLSIEAIGKTTGADSDFCIATVTQDILPVGLYRLSCGEQQDNHFTGITAKAYNGDTFVKNLSSTYNIDYQSLQILYDGYTHIKFYIYAKSGMPSNYNVFYPMVTKETVFSRYYDYTDYYTPFEPYYDNYFDMLIDKTQKQRIKIHRFNDSITVSNYSAVRCNNCFSIYMQFTANTSISTNSWLFSIPYPQLQYKNTNLNDDCFVVGYLNDNSTPNTVILRKSSSSIILQNRLSANNYTLDIQIPVF